MYISYVNSDQIKSQIRDAVRKHLPDTAYHIFLFGSRITGNMSERSDIDIGVEGPETVAPITKMLIQEELERIPVLYRFDFVDFHDVSESFKQRAIQHTEQI